MKFPHLCVVALRALAVGQRVMRFAALLAALSIASPILHAQQNVTWTTGTSDGNWATGASWLGGTAPTTGDSVFFEATTGTTALTYNIANTAPAWGGITFNAAASAYTISGGTMTMAGGTAAITNNSTSLQVINSVIDSGFTVAGTGNVTIGSALRGSGPLIKNGAGTLNLAGASSAYSGAITLNSGTLSVNAAGALGSGSPSVVMGGGNMRFTAGTGPTLSSLSMPQSGTIAIAAFNFGNISISSLSGTGALTLNGENGTNGIFQRGIYLTGTSNAGFSGALSITNASFLRLDHQGALGTSGTVTFNGGRLNTAANITLDRTTLLVEAGGLTFSPSTGGTATLNSALSGAGGVTFRPGFTGLSTIALGGSNSFTGTMLLDAFNNEYVEVRLLSDTAVNSNAIEFLPRAAATIARLEMNGRSATVSRLATVGGVAERAWVDNSAAGTASLTVGSLNQSSTFAGIIRNTGGALSLTKIGTGTQTLSGTNTYSGATTISGGVLALGANGSFANSPVIRVGSAGSSNTVLDLTAKTGTFAFTSSQTVGGIGTINIGSGKTVSVAGIWAPGNSIGSNSVTGNLTVSGTSQFEFGTPGASLASPGSSDFTAVSGTLTLGGSLQLIDNANADGLGSYAAGSYRLFTAPTVSGTFANVTAPAAATTTRVGMVYTSGTASGQGVFANVYNLASATSAQVVNVGNVRVGTAQTAAVSLTNTAPVNATYTETLSTGGFASTSSGFTATGTAGGIAGGASGSGSLLVGLGSGFAAGPQSGTTVLSLFSNAVNSSGLAQQSIAAQTITITGTAWNPAAATTSGSVNLGTVIVGASQFSKALSITNSAPTDGFSESLNASFGTLSGVTTNSGSISLLAAGGTNASAMIVALATGSVGNLSGSAQINFATDGQGTSGLAAASLAPQSVDVFGTVLDHATSSLGSTLLTSTTISLGTYNYATNTWESGGSTGLFEIHNLASAFGAELTADLSLVSVTGTGNGFTTNLGSYTDIAGGNSSQYTIFFDTAGLSAVGMSSTTFQIAMSDQTGLAGATATNTLNVTAQVIVVPEPGAVALAGVGVAIAAWTFRRRRIGPMKIDHVPGT